MRRGDKERRKRLMVPTGSRGPKPREHEFYEEVLWREDKKRELDVGGPGGTDEKIPSCDHSREIGGPVRIPSQASRSSRLNDENKKRGREQSRLREVKNRRVGARLVARDFKTKRKESMFAAMPPLEAKELMFRMCAKEPLVYCEGKWQTRKLMFIDVKKAHLNGKVQEGERS